MSDSEVTYIDVFELPESAIDGLVDNWRARAEQLRQSPGFRDGRLHRTVRPDTRFPLITLARWGSPELLEAARSTADWRTADDRIPTEARAGAAAYRTVLDYGPAAERDLDGPGVTFVNVFEIAPETVTEFTEGWGERARMMRAAPGFRAVRLHRALSEQARFQLVNVAQWDSLEAWQAAAGSSAMRTATDTARIHATPNTGIYRVAVEFA
ncbi:Heme-degrading monooxygenase HmoA [Nocardia amikacinitolerans]|uniref:antibiotic biosynthesis monooxygenase family protein n=1 Tax=Nocardia amikacinitolerans TaxID=756689 RepID=UPI0009FCD9F7|nr:antibiotic biosynthesis monooxygenase [Nocardia amikacinitolerans]MCP2320057.1 Heme-degrading monooxygenase HmoA [Nocardia amikacinitolerans]